MGGNREGGKKSVQTNLKKYGEGYYGKIGSIGGKAKGPKGFGSHKVGKDGLTGFERSKIVRRKK